MPSQEWIEAYKPRKRELAQIRYHANPVKFTTAARACKDRNPERHKANLKRWHEANADRRASDQLFRKYGITLADYNRMFEAKAYVLSVDNRRR